VLEVYICYGNSWQERRVGEKQEEEMEGGGGEKGMRRIRGRNDTQ